MANQTARPCRLDREAALRSTDCQAGRDTTLRDAGPGEMRDDAAEDRQEELQLKGEPVLELLNEKMSMRMGLLRRSQA